MPSLSALIVNLGIGFKSLRLRRPKPPKAQRAGGFLLPRLAEEAQDAGPQRAEVIRGVLDLERRVRK